MHEDPGRGNGNFQKLDRLIHSTLITLEEREKKSGIAVDRDSRSLSLLLQATHEFLTIQLAALRVLQPASDRKNIQLVRTNSQILQCKATSEATTLQVGIRCEGESLEI